MKLKYVIPTGLVLYFIPASLISAYFYPTVKYNLPIEMLVFLINYAWANVILFTCFALYKREQDKQE